MPRHPLTHADLVDVARNLHDIARFRVSSTRRARAPGPDRLPHQTTLAPQPTRDRAFRSPDTPVETSPIPGPNPRSPTPIPHTHPAPQSSAQLHHRCRRTAWGRGPVGRTEPPNPSNRPVWQGCWERPPAGTAIPRLGAPGWGAGTPRPEGDPQSRMPGGRSSESHARRAILRVARPEGDPRSRMPGGRSSESKPPDLGSVPANSATSRNLHPTTNPRSPTPIPQAPGDTSSRPAPPPTGTPSVSCPHPSPVLPCEIHNNATNHVGDRP